MSTVSLVSLILALFFRRIEIISGQAKELSVKISGAASTVYGTDYVLSCSVSPASSISEPLVFQSASGTTFTSVCTVQPSCTQSSTESRYQCKCTSTTGDTKGYQMTITQARKSDVSKLRCMVGTKTSRIMSVQKKASSFPVQSPGKKGAKVPAVSKEGLYVTISGATSAYYGNTYILTCTVHSSSLMKSPLIFQRGLGVRYHAVCTIGTNCKGTPQYLRFTCRCANTTGDAKDFVLMVEHAGERDISRLRCQVGTLTSKVLMVMKKVVDLTIKGEKAITLGSKYLLRCTASPPEEIKWPLLFQRSFGKKIGTSCTIDTSCKQISPIPGIQCKCEEKTAASVVFKLTEQNVTQRESMWRCSLGEVQTPFLRVYATKSKEQQDVFLTHDKGKGTDQTESKPPEKGTDETETTPPEKGTDETETKPPGKGTDETETTPPKTKDIIKHQEKTCKAEEGSTSGKCINRTGNTDKTVLTGFGEISIVGHNYTFQCSVTDTNILPVTFVRNGNIICVVLKNCAEDSALTGYSCKCAGDRGASKVFNLTINNLSIADQAIWICSHNISHSKDFYLEVYAQYKIIKNALESLTAVHLPFSVSVTGSCTYKSPICTWKYKVEMETEKNVADSLTKKTNSSDVCTSGGAETDCTLYFNDVPSEFASKQISLSLSINHPTLGAAGLHVASPIIKFPDVENAVSSAYSFKVILTVSWINILLVVDMDYM